MKPEAEAASGVEAELNALGLPLPEPLKLPGGAKLQLAWVRVCGSRAWIAAHPPQAPDGSIAAPLGKVGADLSVEEGYQAARLATLSMLASLKRELGDLDRVVGWLKIFGMVNSAPGFTMQPQVINGCSELILELYGVERGRHARSAVGMSDLPFNIPVEIDAEVEIRD